jgi:hypothetical protein
MSLRRRSKLAAQRFLAPTLLSATVCGVLLPGTALAQKGEAQIQDDIEFAKGLAREWGFVDLASDVILQIEKGGVSSKMGERLGVVKCDIYAQAALAERDRIKRNELFELAIAAYEDFLKKNPNAASAASAESDYINASSAFAKSLEISMEEAIGEEAEQLRQRRIEVLTAAVARTGALIDNLKSLEEPSESQHRECGNVMLLRGRMLLELGRTQEDGEFSFQTAHQILEEAVFYSGEGTPTALRAYDLIGQVYGAQADWESSAIYFEAVIEQALPSDSQMWDTMVKDLELTQADKDQRWLFLELSSAGLVEAKMNSGDVEGAMRYAMHLYNSQKKEGFEYSKMGYQSLLTAGNAMLDAGGVIGGNSARGEGKWYPSEEAARDGGESKRFILPTTDMALKIGQQVVAENQGSVLQIKGQKLMASVLSRPGVVVETSVLYEAAEGKYNAREDLDALEAFKVVLASLEGKGKSSALEFAPGTYFRMGRTYQRLDRHLEAAMAFREGCTTFAGDPQYDGSNSKGFYNSMQELTRSAPGDEQLKALLEQSERLAASMSEGDADEINFGLAEKARRGKEFEEAIEKYKLISKSANDYEKAIVNTAVCYYRLGQKDEGYKRFVDYLDNFVTDSLNSTGESPVKQTKRLDAMATATFYRVLHESGLKQYADVIAHGESYYLDYPEQTSMAPWTMRLVGEAMIATGKSAAAKSYLEKALETYPDNGHVATFAVGFYKELKRQQEAESDAEKKRALLREMAELLAIGNKAASKPNFGNMRAESNHWYDLGEWETARVVLEKLVAKFGEDAEYEKDMVSYILPDLAHVYLAQHKVPEAHAILANLVTSMVKKPSKVTLIDYTRSVTGWLEGDSTDIRVVPGAGTTDEDFQDATSKLNALANSVDAKWGCEWYSYKFQTAYAYYVWATAEGGPKVSSWKETAKSQLDALVQELGEQFRGKAGVDGVGKTCDSDPEYADELGDDVLRRRMVWLWGKVK